MGWVDRGDVRVHWWLGVRRRTKKEGEQFGLKIVLTGTTPSVFISARISRVSAQRSARRQASMAEE